MLRILGTLLLIAVIISAVKIALVLLLLAGLIFRTRETIGLIIVLGLLTAFNAHPAIGLTIAGMAGVITLWRTTPTPIEDTVKLPPPDA